jgi:hypothetical protein
MKTSIEFVFDTDDIDSENQLYVIMNALKYQDALCELSNCLRSYTKNGVPEKEAKTADEFALLIEDKFRCIILEKQTKLY